MVTISHFFVEILLENDENGALLTKNSGQNQYSSFKKQHFLQMGQ